MIMYGLQQRVSHHHQANFRKTHLSQFNNNFVKYLVNKCVKQSSCLFYKLRKMKD